MHDTTPRMVEAFDHPQGSAARAQPGGATGWRGVLLHVHVAPEASAAMHELAEARLIAGRGIEGDRYFLGIGTYSPKPDVREVSLIEQEVLDALARNDPPLQGGPVLLAPREHRRCWRSCRPAWWRWRRAAGRTMLAAARRRLGTRFG